jgi:hypothetical protein
MKKVTNPKHQQQGDVTIAWLPELPEGKQTVIAKGRCVLAHGESGHSHVVEDDEAELIQIGERILLKLTRAATVTHEEHKPQTLTPGIWEIGRVQEYDYLSQMSRPVQD